MNQVCLKTASWIFVLMLVFPGSVLFAEDPPSARDREVRETPPVVTTPVPPALHHALARPLAEAASFGTKAIPTPPTGTWGIISEGTGGGGIFRDTDSEAEAWLGAEQVGVHGFGTLAGGHFEDSDATGYAWVGHADAGIEAGGSHAGGFFVDSDDSGWAKVGHGNFGIEARGSEMGGYFEDSDGSGFAHLGWGNTGVFGRGNVAGGAFDDRDGSGYARVGYGDRGVDAGGNEMGGYFEDSNGTGQAYLGYGDYGVRGGGNGAGGYFEDLDGTGWAEVASGNRGIQGWGTETGGFFADSDQTAHAYVGYGEWGIEAWGTGGAGYFANSDGYSEAYLSYDSKGIEAHGSRAGGYFEDMEDSGKVWLAHGHTGIEAFGRGLAGEFDNDYTGFAWVAYDDMGIYATGADEGGWFVDWDDDTLAKVAFGSYSIQGNGTKAFVQNHPYDRDSVIVYAAPEGDEVATYTRGTAKLVDGEATVALGETFKWVTNPDVGLTVHLTPVGDPCVLFVADQATDQITVNSESGTDCTFHYLVYGLRIGFEESSIVQEKIEEAYIPSMASHRERYQRRPDLRRFSSLERFKGMRRAVGEKTTLDLSRAHALRDAIIEFDPAVHELPRPPDIEEMAREDGYTEDDEHSDGMLGGEHVRVARADRARRLAPGRSGLSAEIPVNDEGNVYSTSFPPSSGDLASLVDVSEAVEPGDVLVIDKDSAGMMRRGFVGHDRGVIGVVAANTGVVLGSQPTPSQISKPIEETTEGAPSHQAPVALAGVVTCKVDAGYGAVWPGDLLVTSPTPGHAMRTDSPLPGTMVGKALDQLEEGTGLIRVLVMLR